MHLGDCFSDWTIQISPNLQLLVFVLSHFLHKAALLCQQHPPTSDLTLSNLFCRKCKTQPSRVPEVQTNFKTLSCLVLTCWCYWCLFLQLPSFLMPLPLRWTECGSLKFLRLFGGLDRHHYVSWEMNVAACDKSSCFPSRRTNCSLAECGTSFHLK